LNFSPSFSWLVASNRFCAFLFVPNPDLDKFGKVRTPAATTSPLAACITIELSPLVPATSPERLGKIFHRSLRAIYHDHALFSAEKKKSNEASLIFPQLGIEIQEPNRHLQERNRSQGSVKGRLLQVLNWAKHRPFAVPARGDASVSFTQLFVLSPAKSLQRQHSSASQELRIGTSHPNLSLF
jgi:hypothetical protein